MTSRSAGLVLVALAVVCTVSPALGKGWDAPNYTLRLNTFAAGDAYPGSIGTGPDHGFEPAFELGTGRRLSKAAKFAATISAGGRVQQHFTRANYGWAGLGTTLRRNKTTYSLASEWTPKRNKFPTDPEEGGQYTGTDVTAGLRQSVGARTKFRVEGTFSRDRFVAPFTPRDTDGLELFSSLIFTPVKGTDLRGEASFAHDEGASPKYNKNTRWVGAAVVWSDSTWRADVGARSGLRQYPDNILGDSNFQRRDQWIELRLRVTRSLGPRLSAAFSANLTDQTSVRTDRTFNVHSFTLGCEWTGGGK